jgi:hypothetical protein
MGKSTPSSSGVTGAPLIGEITGAGLTGLSALMLYHCRGMSFSDNMNRVWLWLLLDMVFLLLYVNDD